MAILSKEQKQACRKEIIEDLKKILKKAYSGVTCREYEAIRGVTFLLELMRDREEDNDAGARMVK